jgi:GNAT superfamily N-acetyltransferase
MQFTIRDATREDGPELLALVRGLNQHQRDPVEHFDAEILERDVFGQDAYLGTLVAEHDGALAGYAFFHDAYESGYAQRGLYLCDLYVTPAARRSGVGRALVAAVAKRATEGGRTFLWWAARAWNEEARGFYASLGATEEAVTAHALTFTASETLAEEADETSRA